MDERELLEMAAKAAGLTYTGVVVLINPDEMYLFTKEYDRWNPLFDDGEALRLAVGLRLCLTPGSARAWVDPPDEQQSAATMEPYGNDEMAATRRAIVRAAAEIGRSMQPHEPPEKT